VLAGGPPKVASVPPTVASGLLPSATLPHLAQTLSYATTVVRLWLVEGFSQLAIRGRQTLPTPAYGTLFVKKQISCYTGHI